MGARLMCAALLGVQGRALEVTAVTEPGLPGLEQRGLGEDGLGDRAERVCAAVAASGLPWPAHKTVVTVSPSRLPRHDGAVDLAMAVAVLAGGGAVPAGAAAGVMYYAGLAPSGTLVPLPGALQAAGEAARAGCRAVVVAARNAAEARLAAPGVLVVGASRLGEVTGWLRGGDLPGPVPVMSPRPGRAGSPGPAGDRAARLAAEVSAAGGHHLALTGPPGSGAAQVARLVRALLPPLEPGTAMEVTAVYSAAGAADPGGPLVRVPPFVVPPHSASPAEMTCGQEAGLVKPGAAALAHRGVLYLSEAPYFDAGVLGALRGPAESGTVSLGGTISRRAAAAWRVPARFTLVTASSPCPCQALRPEPAACTCSPAARSRYAARLSGPLSDRISLRATLTGLPQDRDREPVAAGAARVAAARERAAARLAGTPWRVNADIPAEAVTSWLMPAAGDFTPVRVAMEAGLLNGYAAADTLRVAWTLADLAGRPGPTALHCAAAVALRTGESR